MAASPTPPMRPIWASSSPVIERSAFTSGGYPLVEGLTRDDYRKSYAKMVQLVGKLHKAGVPIVAGTDGWGIELIRELEIYQQGRLHPGRGVAERDDRACAHRRRRQAHRIDCRRHRRPTWSWSMAILDRDRCAPPRRDGWSATAMSWTATHCARRRAIAAGRNRGRAPAGVQCRKSLRLGRPRSFPGSCGRKPLHCRQRTPDPFRYGCVAKPHRTGRGWISARTSGLPWRVEQQRQQGEGRPEAGPAQLDDTAPKLKPGPDGTLRRRHRRAEQQLERRQLHIECISRISAGGNMLRAAPSRCLRVPVRVPRCRADA
jgi:hypothetical protein